MPMTKRVLVTGASGFVGRHSPPALSARGFDVHAVHARGAPGAASTWHRVDLFDPDRVARLLDEVRPTHLLHLAWFAVHGKYWTATENLRWVEASLSLLRGFVERGGRRAVIAGTCAEYDWRFGSCSERTTPTAPSTLYGVSKNALQAVSSAFAAQVGLSLAWGRIFFPYGPDEQPRRLVPSVIQALLKRETVRCSHGDQYRDFLYVEDCADAFAALLDSRVEGPVNIASGRPVTIKEVVRTTVSLMPEAAAVPIEFGALPTPPDDPPLLVADVRRLAGEVGWTPRVDLPDGLARSIASWRSRIGTRATRADLGRIS
jgi:nucleoside-diphosphate-sugar epimerase